LEKPEAVTTTRLPKYIATVSQILDLQENELDWLARHLGHDIRVHREHYRLHDSTIELAKVGKFLYTVDEGKTTQWAGKSLDEIDLNSGLVEDDRELDQKKIVKVIVMLSYRVRVSQCNKGEWREQVAQRDRHQD